MDSRLVSTNPFVHDVYNDLTWFDYIKIALATFTILPIRFILSFIIFILSMTYANVAYLILSIIGNEAKCPTEYHKLRTQLIQPCLWLLRAMLFISGIRKIVHIDKSNGTNNAPIILFAPHTSFFDLYPGIFLPGTPSFISRQEAQNVFFFGRFLKLAGTIFVKRESQSSRQETIECIKAAAKDRRIAICPEGVCGNGSQLVKFKVGAFSPGLAVQPIIIKYKYSSGRDTTSWTPEGPPFRTLVWLTLCQLYIDIEATILPKYDPSEAEKSDPKLFAENVRRYVSNVSGVRCSPFIFDDVFFLKLAREMAIPKTPVCIKLLKLAYKMSAIGNRYSELSADTNNGTKSEDTDLLFKDRNVGKVSTMKNLGLLVQRVKKFEPTDTMDIAAILELPSELESSNAVEELTESIKNKNLSANEILSIGAILCDVQSFPDIWVRVEAAVKYISAGGGGGHMNRNQWTALLWVLIGINSDQVHVTISDRDLTFDRLKGNVCIDYKRAVHDCAPSLVVRPPVDRS